MFGTIKLSGKKMIIISLGCLAVLAAVCLTALRSGAPDSVTILGESYPLAVEDDEDIEEFIEACGYEPEGCASDESVKVPKVWNDTYTAYNELQKSQGLDLERYKGKSARQLTYALKGSDDFAVALVSDGRIIAAHLTGLKQGEELRPLIQNNERQHNDEATTG